MHYCMQALHLASYCMYHHNALRHPTPSISFFVNGHHLLLMCERPSSVLVVVVVVVVVIVVVVVVVVVVAVVVVVVVVVCRVVVVALSQIFIAPSFHLESVFNYAPEPVVQC